MDPDILKKARKELARQGGIARAKALTPEQRLRSALKASKAAAAARRKKAAERKRSAS